MGRPLKHDNYWAVGQHWCAEVQAATGSRRRIKRTFFTQADAKQWHGHAIAALQNGQPIPEPEHLGLTQPQAGQQPLASRTSSPATAGQPVPGVQRSAPAAPGQSAVSPHPAIPAPPTTPIGPHSTIDAIAWAWHDEYYTLLLRAQPSTAVAKAADLTNVILPALHAAGFHNQAGVSRNGYIALQLHFAGITLLNLPPRARAASSSTLAVGEWLSTAEVKAAGVPRSTLMRLKGRGALPNTRKVDGKLQFSRQDLIAAGKLPADDEPAPAAEPRIYAQATATEFLRVIHKILDYAIDVAGWDLGFDYTKVPSATSQAPKAPARKELTLTETLAIMRHLHAVHQCALVLMRVMGLRISEAFGVRVGDIVDLGPEGGGRGVLPVRAQGGKAMLERDAKTGEFVSVEFKNRLKTEASYRTLVIPAAVMEVVRLIIAVFHTAPDGTVDPTARFIPGLTRANACGQEAFRHAMARGASAEGITLGEDLDIVLLPRPHDLRKGAITDLAWTPELSELARKRFGGHITGDDVHHLIYVLDHPDLAPMRAAADALDARLKAEAPDGLVVPTTSRCTLGRHRALRGRAQEIDAALMECGWLISAAGFTDDGDELLDSVAVAEAFSIERVTAARWMATGVLPARTQMLGGRQRHLATRTDVEALREQLNAGVTCEELAKELDVPYQRVYQLWRNRGMEGALVRGRRVLESDVVDQIRAIITADAARDARAMPLAEAATTLGRSVYAVKQLAEAGDLTFDPATGVNGARYVTRASVATYLAAHPPIQIRRRNAKGRRRDQRGGS